MQAFKEVRHVSAFNLRGEAASEDTGKSSALSVIVVILAYNVPLI